MAYADILLQRAACYMSYWRTMTSPEREAVSEKIKASLNEAAKKVSFINYGRRQAMLNSLQEVAREAGVLS